MFDFISAAQLKTKQNTLIVHSNPKATIVTGLLLWGGGGGGRGDNNLKIVCIQIKRHSFNDVTKVVRMSISS